MRRILLLQDIFRCFTCEERNNQFLMDVVWVGILSRILVAIRSAFIEFFNGSSMLCFPQLKNATCMIKYTQCELPCYS